jgi:hypothetical protein
MSRAAGQTKTQSRTKNGSKSTKKNVESVETALEVLVSALRIYDDAGGEFDIIPLPEKKGVGIFLGNCEYFPEDGDIVFLGTEAATP